MSLIEKTVYKYENERKQYRGLVLKNPEFNDYLKDRVNKRFFDASGSLNLQKLFEDVSQTGFNSDLIKSAFTSDEIPLDWKKNMMKK
ncbi:MAG: hypothetical protein J4F36_03525 [Nitrosopumilaceae archaeon]|nr:hypothetical protein [Nitrosopumilaceae archaeon]